MSAFTKRKRDRERETRFSTQPANSSTLFPAHSSSSSVVDTLRIRELEHELNMVNNEADKAKARYTRQLTEAETKATMYGAQVDRLAQQIESLVVRNADTSAQKVESDLNARGAQDRVDQLENNSATLRKLLTELLGNPSEAKLQSMEETKFWDQFATPEIMAKSRPPSSYRVPTLEMVQAHPLYSQELDTARARLRISDQELKRVKNEMERLQTDLISVRAAHSSRHATAQAMIAKQRKWLMGTVRRIKWVIKKRTEAEKRLTDRDAYVSKLENKLLHQAMAIRKQREVIRSSRGTGRGNGGNGGNGGKGAAVGRGGGTGAGGAGGAGGKGGGDRSIRGGKKNNGAGSGTNNSENTTINTNNLSMDESAMRDARTATTGRAERIVSEFANSSGPPSPQMRKNLSSLMMSSGDTSGEAAQDVRIVRSVPMSPLKSPAPKKQEERTALDVLAEEEDDSMLAEFTDEDIAKYTQQVTTDIFEHSIHSLKTQEGEGTSVVEEMG